MLVMGVGGALDPSPLNRLPPKFIVEWMGPSCAVEQHPKIGQGRPLLECCYAAHQKKTEAHCAPKPLERVRGSCVKAWRGGRRRGH